MIIYDVTFGGTKSANHEPKTSQDDLFMKSFAIAHSPFIYSPCATVTYVEEKKETKLKKEIQIKDQLQL